MVKNFYVRLATAANAETIAWHRCTHVSGHRGRAAAFVRRVLRLGFIATNEMKFAGDNA
jgi:hypothetical protein